MDCAEKNPRMGRDAKDSGRKGAGNEEPPTSGSQKPGPERGGAEDYLADFARGRLDNDATIEAFARAGLREEVVASLALLCQTSSGVVERLLSQPGRETVHVLARAAGLSWPAAKAILEMRAGRDGLAAHELERSRARFERLTPEAARRFLQFFRHRPGGKQ